MNVISEQVTFTIQRFYSPVSSPGVINVHIHHDLVGGCSASSGAELRWSCAPRPLINYCIWIVIVVHSSLIIMLLYLILSLICFAWSWKIAPPFTPLARARGGVITEEMTSPTIVTFFVRSRGHCSRKPLDTYTWTSFDVGWRYLPDIPSALQLCHWDQTTPCCSYCSTSSHPVTWSYQTDDSCDREELSVVWELEDCAHETARNEEMFFLEVQ